MSMENADEIKDGMIITRIQDFMVIQKVLFLIYWLLQDYWSNIFIFTYISTKNDFAPIIIISTRFKFWKYLRMGNELPILWYF